ncbi:MAG TPA: autotransporter domain-containing protein [Microvirga sp.]|jgi:outer membrane autotransporter protein
MLALLPTGAAQATCSTLLPVSGTTVICEGPTPQQGPVQAQPGSTDVNVQVRAGSAVTTANSDTAILVRDGSAVTNAGTVSTTGASAQGLLILGSGSTLTNGGTVSTTGNSADAMEAVGSNNTITNRGQVTTQGSSADALRAVGSGNAILNEGTVTTAGSSGRALVAEGAGNRVTNGAAGTVTTTGAGADGIRADGNGATLTNEGRVSTSGFTSDGIRQHGNDGSVTNSGTIATSGLEARGVKLEGGGNLLRNTGTIEATGTDAEGVYSMGTAGQVNTIVNEGRIVSRFEAAIRGIAGIERVENHGFMETTAANGIAVTLADGDDRFLISAGSTIRGAVDAGRGTDTFALGGSRDATFDIGNVGPGRQYRNFEEYEKTGTSTWTVRGTNDGSMPWSVNQGTLLVIGQMGGSIVVVRSGATLGGTGTVGAIDARPGSTLTPGVGGIGTLSVTGNVLIAAGTTYRVDLNPGLQADRIVAGGTARVEGGTVRVQAVPGTYLPGSRWVILNARGGVTGTFAQVTTDLAYFQPLQTSDANNIYLELRAAEPEAPQDPGNPRPRPGARPVLPAPPVSVPVLVADLPRFTDLASGEPHPTATGIALRHDDLFRGAILCRLRCSSSHGIPVFAAMETTAADYMADLPARGRAPVAQAPASRSAYGLWGKAIGSWGHTEAQGATASVERATGGVVVGAEAGLGTPYRLGLAAGYLSTRFDIDGRLASGEVESAHVGLYGQAAFGSLTLRGGAAYAHHAIDLSRAVVLSNFSGAARDESDTSSLQAFGELGYLFTLGRGVTLEPFAGLAHIHVGSRRIEETGSAIALVGTADSFDVTYSTLGARMAATIPTSAGAVTVKGMLGWRHAFGDTDPSAVFAFAAGSRPFLVTGAPIDRDSLVVEAGIHWAVTQNVSLGIAYDGALGPRDQEHTVKGSLSVRF